MYDDGDTNDDVDDTDWTLDHMEPGGHDETNPPNRATTCRLVQDLHRAWIRPRVNNEPLCARNLMRFLGERFSVDLNQMDWDHFYENLFREHCRILKLHKYLDDYKVEKEAVERMLLYEVARFVYNAHGLFKETTRFLKNSDPQTNRNLMLPPELRNPDIFDSESENTLERDSKKLTPYQSALLTVIDHLHGRNYRRAGASFFKKTKTQSLLDTNAFEEAVTIENFVYTLVHPSVDYKLFVQSENSQTGVHTIVKYLKERVLPEAPDLEECHHLRSYEGDSVGRGAGIYDSFFDVFFPYATRASWSSIAELANQLRGHRMRKGKPYKCVPPENSQVCVVHLDCVFPYDIVGELQCLKRDGATTLWRNAEEFECRRSSDAVASRATPLIWEHVSVDDDAAPIEGVEIRVAALSEALVARREAGRSGECIRFEEDEWDDLYDGVRLPEGGYVHAGGAVFRPVSLSLFLAQSLPLPHTAEEVEPEVIGLTWQKVPIDLCFPPSSDQRWTSLQHEGLVAFFQRNSMYGHILVDEEHAPALEGVTLWTYVEVMAVDGVPEYFVPLRTPATRKRVRVGPDELASFGVQTRRLTDRSYVCDEREGTKRFFRLYKGRTWLECRIDPIDHIYICQQFDVHDRFMLYACKGRLFFEVGELDDYELTLFFEGVGGCGKSTIMNATKKFWPPHLRGELSPNMQPQFGMSAVAKAMIVFCNEVSSELNIPQEEWQIACSGEIGSFNVKFKDPLTKKWTSQMFWVGNSFPSKFRNLQKQVSRRLAGVLMQVPIRERDGGIFSRILVDLGALQRKEVLAYFDLLDVLGTTQPTSVPDKYLPPAFAEYYYRTVRATDPVEDFLCEGTFVSLDTESRILLDDFKELYNQYRLKYDMGKSFRWNQDVYRNAFNQRGITVRRMLEVEINNEVHTNVEVVQGVAALKPV